MDESHVVINFDPEVFSIDAIKKAAYVLSSTASFDISVEKNILRVVAKSLDEHQRFNVERFRREVLDQDLRLKVWQETSSIRDVILAQAFSNANLLSPDLDTTDVLESPGDFA